MLERFYTYKRLRNYTYTRHTVIEWESFLGDLTRPVRVFTSSPLPSTLFEFGTITVGPDPGGPVGVTRDFDGCVSVGETENVLKDVTYVYMSTR